MRLAFRDINIDPERFELTRGGEPVRLEPQAFEVLAHLIRNRDRVVTRDELLDAIWGSVYVSDAALATRIKEARRALGDDGTTQWAIRTIHRRGYRFIVDVEDGAPPQPRVAAAPPAASAAPMPSTSATDAGSDGTTARTAAEPPAGPRVGAPPPIGREAELARLIEHSEGTVRDGTCVVFITGEAGIGKSTLVGEFLRHVGAAEDVLVGRGQCIEGHGSAEAYLPFLDAIGQLASGPRGSVAARALQQEAPTWLLHLPGLAGGGSVVPDMHLTRERMLRELTSALDRIGEEHRVILSLEDLQWSDHSTLDALEMLARRTSNAGVLILGTLRTGDAASGAHPVHTRAAELTARGHASTIHLGPLDAEAVRALVERRAPELASEAVSETVTAKSGGNPLFATSLIEHWRASSPSDGSSFDDVPESLRQLVDQQLEHITPEQRRVMEAAAIAGDTLTPSIVAAISDLDVETVEEILDSCARKGQFLRRRGAFEWPNGDLEDEYQFIHSLFRETALASLPLGRRARMHRAAGQALLQRLGDGASEHIEEIADHFVRGGDADRAVPALLRAAVRARSRSAQREARDAVNQALALLPRIGDEAERTRLEIACRTMAGAIAIALEGWAAPSIQEAYERALELVRQTDDQVLVREILSGLATTHEFRGEYEMSEQIITEQMALVPAGTPPPPESHELLACSLFHQGQLRRSFEEATTGLTIATSPDAPPFRTAYGEHPAIACRGWRAQTQWFLGDVRQALEELEEAISTAPDELSLLHAHTHAGMIAQYAGDVETTRRHARHMFALAQTLGFESHEVESGIMRAWAEAQRGYAPALPLLERAVDLYRSSGMRMDLPWVLGVLADAYLTHDRLEDAEQALDEAFVIRPLRGYIYEPELWRLRGRIAERREQPERAIEHYRRGADTARSYESRTSELRALTDVLRLRHDEGMAERAAELVLELAVDGHQPDIEAARALLAARPA